MLAALAVLWQFGGAALDWVADRRFPSLSRDALPIFFCAVATGLLIAFAISLRSAFTAPRALHRSYVRLGQLVIFIAGVLLGMAIWSGLGDAVQPKSARIEPAARSESPRAAALGDEASASVGAGAPKIGLAAEAASMMPPGEAIAGSPEISAESSAEAVSPVADAAPPAEPEVTVDVTVVETISPPEGAAVPVTAPADDDPPVGETLGDEPVPPVEPTAIAAALVEIAVSDAVALRATARAEEEPAAGEMVKDERASAAEPQQRDEPESPASPAMIAAPDAPTEMIERRRRSSRLWKPPRRRRTRRRRRSA